MLQKVDIAMVSNLQLGCPERATGNADTANAGLNCTLNLGSNVFPHLSHPYHPTCVHHSVSKRMTVISSKTVNSPIICFQICHLSVSDCDVLDISPSKFRVGFQEKGDDTSCHGRTCTCASVA